MMLAVEAVAPAVVAGAGAVLEAIREPGCAIAVWRRTLDPGFAAALAMVDGDEVDDIAARIDLTDLALHVPLLLGSAGYDAAAGVPLAHDLIALADRFAALGGWTRLTVRLDWIDTDACRRFHVDMVETRLLVTYVGRGTQWKRVGEDDAVATELVAGDVAILKGRLLAPDAPILHRSPPIAADGGRRLLLAIDGAAR